MKSLKIVFLVVDVSFIAYWLATVLHLIPDSVAFKDYSNPIVSAWNWSFLPLDLLISATGLTSVALWRREDPRWRPVALMSLVFTMTSGLQALAFWAIRGEFDGVWWGANGFLLLYPLFFLPGLLCDAAKSREPSAA
jgi:hypothetical protein